MSPLQSRDLSNSPSIPMNIVVLSQSYSLQMTNNAREDNFQFQRRKRNSKQDGLNTSDSKHGQFWTDREEFAVGELQEWSSNRIERRLGIASIWMVARRSQDPDSSIKLVKTEKRWRWREVQRRSFSLAFRKRVWRARRIGAT